MAAGSSFKFIAGLFVGGFIGAAAVIVFGPELDEQTRRRLREEGLQWRERAIEMATMARAEAMLLRARGQELIALARVRWDEALAESKEAAAEKQRELQKKWEQAQDTGEAPL